MKTSLLVSLFGAIVLGGAICAEAASWSHVEQKYRGCHNRFDKCERLLSDFEAGVHRLEMLKSLAADGEAFNRFYLPLANKIEHGEIRVERLKRMSEKIADDIQKGSASGGGCPECIVSSVDLYCRQVEAVSLEFKESLSAIREFETSAERSKDVKALIERNRTALEQWSAQINPGEHGDKLEAARSLQAKSEQLLHAGKIEEALTVAAELKKTIGANRKNGVPAAENRNLDSLIATARTICDKSSEPAAQKIFAKAEEHYKQALKLKGSGNSGAAVKEEAVARELIEQALSIASGEK